MPQSRLAIHFFFPPHCRKLIQLNTERIRSYSFPFSSFILFSTNSNLSWEVSLAPDSLSFFSFISPFSSGKSKEAFSLGYLLSPFTSCIPIHVILLTSAHLFSLRMGDHFALMRDRMITEATLHVVIESMNSSESACIVDEEPSVKEGGESNCDERLVQCRICHDEDLACEMDAPCSCIGSLKYVHPRCVLRWCQEKGNTNCEICLKQFRGYILHRRIVLHMRDSIIRANYEMQQRSTSRPQQRISTDNYTQRNPGTNHSTQSKSEKLMLCFLLTIFLVPLKFFVAALVVLLIIFFIAAPALKRLLYQQQETNEPVRGADLNV